MTLDRVRPRHRFIVTEVRDCSERLLELGMTAGTEAVVLRRAPFGGPIEILLRGYALALRRSTARRISVEEVR